MEGVRLATRPLALETVAGTEPDGVDAVESVGLLAEVDGAEPAATPPPETVDEIFALPPSSHLARPIELGAITSALARVASRSARPGEAPAEAHMREVAARYLALRLEVSEGVAKISIG